MSILSSPIAVIGAGAWGGALAVLLASNGNAVRLWGKDTAQLHSIKTSRRCDYLPDVVFPENIQICDSLLDCLHGVDDILIVVPSHAFADVLAQIKPIAHANTRIAWGTKGLDPATRSCLHELVSQVFSDDMPMAALSGPSFAKEVALGLPTAVSLSGNNPAFSQDLITRLHNDCFRVYENADFVGVELCGVMKNILAIAVGISDGLGLGANARCALITRGLAEMARFSEALGGQKKTLMSLAGVGDLILTCTTDLSRNRRFGLAIGRGDDCQAALASVGGVVEGFSNVKQVYELALQHQLDMPITQQVYGVLYSGFAPKKVVSELLERAPKRE